jgi:hypothetical protein
MNLARGMRSGALESAQAPAYAMLAKGSDLDQRWRHPQVSRRRLRRGVRAEPRGARQPAARLRAPAVG